MGKKITGRRRPDLPEGDIQPDLAVGDYWKVLGADGTPKRSDAKSNLTGTCWMVAVPLGRCDESYYSFPGNASAHSTPTPKA